MTGFFAKLSAEQKARVLRGADVEDSFGDPDKFPKADPAETQAREEIESINRSAINKRREAPPRPAEGLVERLADELYRRFVDENDDTPPRKLFAEAIRAALAAKDEEIARLTRERDAAISAKDGWVDMFRDSGRDVQRQIDRATRAEAERDALRLQRDALCVEAARLREALAEIIEWDARIRCCRRPADIARRALAGEETR
jgi:hypothetical protein